MIIQSTFILASINIPTNPLNGIIMIVLPVICFEAVGRTSVYLFSTLPVLLTRLCGVHDLPVSHEKTSFLDAK